ncbi:GCN5 family acetyltransferase [Thalassospira profundimaris]|uniref:GCN5 family acetyltransferase n=1 Tax=Thalassospira profundimaris TaxID=502049 RepID=A0A367XCM1_9PROT|nr:GNAT family protein [Thalassospira profundimaris]RCK51189.1 GCN5 family acetyltransferase [Thalassospira profundimaris]
MKTLATDRLILRNFTKNDAEDLFAYLNVPTISCFLCLALENIEKAAQEAEKRSKSDDYIAVCDKSSGQVIGDVFGVAEKHEKDVFAVGWNFNPSFQGKGFAHEAASALFDHLFTEKNARHLYAYVEDTNLSSENLCKKLGMRKEGHFIEFVSFKNDANGNPIYENTLQYALLKREWDAQRVK